MALNFDPILDAAISLSDLHEDSDVIDYDDDIQAWVASELERDTRVIPTNIIARVEHYEREFGIMLPAIDLED